MGGGAGCLPAAAACVLPGGRASGIRGVTLRCPFLLWQRMQRNVTRVSRRPAKVASRPPPPPSCILPAADSTCPAAAARPARGAPVVGFLVPPPPKGKGNGKGNAAARYAGRIAAPAHFVKLCRVR